MEPELTRDSVLKQVGPGFSETDARAIVEHGPEATLFAILTLAKRVAELTGLVWQGGSVRAIGPDGPFPQAENQGPAQEARRAAGTPRFPSGNTLARQNRATQPGTLS